jgi:hypothetical protein
VQSAPAARVNAAAPLTLAWRIIRDENPVPKSFFGRRVCVAKPVLSRVLPVREQFRLLR